MGAATEKAGEIMYVVTHKTKAVLKTAITKTGGVTFEQSDPLGGKPIDNGEIFVARSMYS